MLRLRPWQKKRSNTLTTVPAQQGRPRPLAPSRPSRLRRGALSTPTERRRGGPVLSALLPVSLQDCSPWVNGMSCSACTVQQGHQGLEAPAAVAHALTCCTVRRFFLLLQHPATPKRVDKTYCQGIDCARHQVRSSGYACASVPC